MSSNRVQGKVENCASGVRYWIGVSPAPERVVTEGNATVLSSFEPGVGRQVFDFRLQTFSLMDPQSRDRVLPQVADCTPNVHAALNPADSRCSTLSTIVHLFTHRGKLSNRPMVKLSVVHDLPRGRRTPEVNRTKPPELLTPEHTRTLTPAISRSLAHTQRRWAYQVIVFTTTIYLVGQIYLTQGVTDAMWLQYFVGFMIATHFGFMAYISFAEGSFPHLEISGSAARPTMCYE